MSDQHPVRELFEIHRTFGPGAARDKARLLKKLEALENIPVRELGQLHDVLDNMRAYPDNPSVRSLVQKVIAQLRGWAQDGASDSPTLVGTGFPGSSIRYPYSYAMVQYLARRHPGSVEVDWEGFEDGGQLGAVLELVLTAVENETMEYIPCGWEEWLDRTGSSVEGSQLGFLLQALERSGMPAEQQAKLFDMCDVPILYRLHEPGTGRCEVELPLARIFYQRGELPRERVDLRKQITTPLEVPALADKRRGEVVIDTCVRALCSRKLEIHGLIYANPEEVLELEAQRGIKIVLVGIRPEYRSPLAANYFFMVLKNAVPIAYGPAVPLFGCCEIGINLFPQFRGAEIRTIYGQLMRLLHHHLGVQYFYLTRYGMGEDNPDAIRSGAFWFYRKLGFKATNPQVEALALEEEAKIQATPGYRSDTRMLHRLSHTEAVLDLSGGRCRRFDFGGLGLAVSHSLSRETGGDRGAATRACVTRVKRRLGIGDARRWSEEERLALNAMAPILALIPSLASWSRGDKLAMVRILRAKGSAPEFQATRAMQTHRKLESALREIAESNQGR